MSYSPPLQILDSAMIHDSYRKEVSPPFTQKPLQPQTPQPIPSQQNPKKRKRVYDPEEEEALHRTVMRKLEDERKSLEDDTTTDSFSKELYQAFNELQGFSTEYVLTELFLSNQQLPYSLSGPRTCCGRHAI